MSRIYVHGIVKDAYSGIAQGWTGYSCGTTCKSEAKGYAISPGHTEKQVSRCVEEGIKSQDSDTFPYNIGDVYIPNSIMSISVTAEKST